MLEKRYRASALESTVWTMFTSARGTGGSPVLEGLGGLPGGGGI